MRSLYLLTLVLIHVAACGDARQAVDPSRAAPAQTHAMASGTQPLACTAALLHDAGGACQSRWRYETYDCFNEGDDPAVIGWSGNFEQRNVTPAMCEHPDFGDRGIALAERRDVELHYAPEGQLSPTHWLTGLVQCERSARQQSTAQYGPRSTAFCEDLGKIHTRHVGYWEWVAPTRQAFYVPIHNSRADKRCGEFSCEGRRGVLVPRRCEHPDFGVRGHYAENYSRRHFDERRPVGDLPHLLHRAGWHPVEDMFKRCEREAQQGLPPHWFARCSTPADASYNEENGNRTAHWHISFLVRLYAPIFHDGVDALRCGSEVCNEIWENDPERPIRKTERHPSFGRASNNECQAPVTVHYEGPGAPKNALSPDNAWAWDGSIGNATCSTDTQNSTNDPRAKFDRLAHNQWQLEMDVSAPALVIPGHDDHASRQAWLTAERARVVASMRLLFELQGSQLRPDQQAIAVALYAERDTADLCGTATTLVQQDAQMRMCERLAQPHADPVLVQARLAQCVARAHALADSAQARKTVSAMANRVIAAGPQNNGSDTETYIDQALAAMAGWHDVVTRSAETSPEEIFEQTTHMVRDMYRQVHNLPGTKGSANLGEMLDEAAKYDALMVDRALWAASAPHVQLRGEPLVVTVAQGLAALTDSAAEAMERHDFACAFAPVAACADKNSAVFRILAPLAKLQQQIDRADDAGPGLMCRASADVVITADAELPWTVALRALTSTGHTLHASLTALADDQIERGWGAVNRPQDRLVAQLQTARDAVARFTETGFYTGAKPAMLHEGLREEKLPEMLAGTRRRLERAKETLAQSRRDKQEALTNLWTAQQHDAATAIQKTLAVEAATRHEQVVRELATTRALLRRAELSVAHDDPGPQKWRWRAAAEAMVPVGHAKRLWLSARHARFTENQRTGPIDAYAVVDGSAAWRLDAAAGDIVKVAVEPGKWAPTCAITQSHFDSPGQVGVARAKVNLASTDTEGYSIAWAQDAYQLSSATQSSEHAESSGTRESSMDCTTLRGAASFGVSLPYFSETIGVEGTHANCVGYFSESVDTERRVQQQGSGSGVRSFVAMEHGLLLPRAPFPNYPVGSLLLVGMPQDATAIEQVRSIDVVRRHTSVVALADTRYFLVVNDLASPACKPTAERIPLEVRQFRLGGNIKSVGAAMARSIDELRTTGEAYEAQGTVTMQQLALLRSNASESFMEGTGISLSEAPDLASFFIGRLEMELTRCELRARVVNLEQARQSAAMQLNHLLASVRDREAGDYFAQLLPRWSLAVVDGAKSRYGVSGIVDHGLDVLHSALRVRYPHVMHQLRHNAQLTELTRRLADQPVFGMHDADPHARATNVLDAYEVIVEALENAAEMGAGRLVPRDMQTLAVTFARPGRPASDILWKVADGPRATRVWAAIDAGEEVRLQVRPEDLFSGEMGNAYQSCRRAAPIVHAVGLFLETRSDRQHLKLNASEARTTLRVDGRLMFPTEAGPDYFSPRPGYPPEAETPLLFGHLNEAVQAFAQHGRQFREGTGLSPFADFIFHAKSQSSVLRQAFKDAQSLTVLFSVDSRKLLEGQGLCWLSACAEQPECIGVHHP